MAYYPWEGPRPRGVDWFILPEKMTPSQYDEAGELLRAAASYRGELGGVLAASKLPNDALIRQTAFPFEHFRNWDLITTDPDDLASQLDEVARIGREHGYPNTVRGLSGLWPTLNDASEGSVIWQKGPRGLEWMLGVPQEPLAFDPYGGGFDDAHIPHILKEMNPANPERAPAARAMGKMADQSIWGWWQDRVGRTNQHMLDAMTRYEGLSKTAKMMDLDIADVHAMRFRPRGKGPLLSSEGRMLRQLADDADVLDNALRLQGYQGAARLPTLLKGAGAGAAGLLAPLVADRLVKDEAKRNLAQSAIMGGGLGGILGWKGALAGAGIGALASQLFG